MKLLFFITVIVYLYSTLIKIYPNKCNLKSNLKPDIIISPSAYNGFYQLGICHYITNNFNYKKKQILGFSSGSWVGLFMCMEKSTQTIFLKNMFKNVGQFCNIKHLIHTFKTSLEAVGTTQFDTTNLNVALSIVGQKKLRIHNDFLNVNDCIQCCIGSSFVPFLTQNELLCFYKNNSVLDGGIFWEKYTKNINKKKVLIINSKLFRTCNSKFWYPFISFKRPKRGLYDLYILGYKNASKNHTYLSTFFN